MKHLKLYEDMENEDQSNDPHKTYPELLFFSKWIDFAEWMKENPFLAEVLSRSLTGLRPLIPPRNTEPIKHTQPRDFLWNHYYGGDYIMLIRMIGGDWRNFVTVRVDVNTAEYDEKYMLLNSKAGDLYGLIHSHEFYRELISTTVKQLMAENPRKFTNNSVTIKRLVQTLFFELVQDASSSEEFNWEEILLKEAISLGFSEEEFKRKLKVSKLLQRSN